MNQNRAKFEKLSQKPDFKQSSGERFRGSDPLEVVMFNMSSFSEWTRGVVNRNYHVFWNLAKNESVKRIISVDFLPFTAKRALRNYWENILRATNYKPLTQNFLAGGRITNIYRDLTSKCVKIEGYPAEIYVFSTIDSIFSHKKVVDKLNKVLKKITQLPDYPITRLPRVVWSYFPMFVDYFDKIPADLTVFDAVDNWIEHPSFVKYRELLKNNYQTIARRSDLIFTVAPTLCDFLKHLGREKNCYFIPLGVDVEHFTGSRFQIQDSRFKKIPRPIIGYVGTIQARVDIDLLEYLARHNPDKSFVLIGPLWPVFLRKLRRPAIEIKRLKRYKNVYLLGRKPYSQTPAYIKNFDLAIIPHYVDRFMKYTGSLKLLEFLASGRPVVATPASGVERFLPLVYIARDPEDFNKRIDQALKDDTIELRARRVEMAQSQDWKLQVGKMMEIIKKF